MSKSEVFHISPSRVGTKSDAAEFFGVSLPTINAWLARGCPVLQRGSRGVAWRLDLRDIAEWYFKPAIQEDEEPFDPEAAGVSPKDRKDWYDSEKKKRELEIIDGLHVPSGEYELEISRVIKSMANFIEILPDRLEREAGLDPKQVIKVQNITDKERDNLYKQLTVQENV